MMTFAMLTRLGPNGAHRPDQLRGLERTVVDRIERECPSVRWIASYVGLGPSRYLDVFKARDIESALKVGLIVEGYGHAETEIWPIVPWTEFKRISEPSEVQPPRSEMERMSAAVAYLQSQDVPFRLTSYPLPEREPTIAHVLRAGAHEVSTTIVTVDGRPGLACFLRGTRVNHVGLGSALGATVLGGGPDDLPGAFAGVAAPIPPFGRLLDVPLFVDERVAACASIAFRTFSDGTFIEMAYDDYARIEDPKVVALAIEGELPRATA